MRGDTMNNTNLTKDDSVLRMKADWLADWLGLVRCLVYGTFGNYTHLFQTPNWFKIKTVLCILTVYS